MSSNKTEVATDKTGYLAYVEKAKRIIESEVSEVTSKIPDLALTKKIQYVLQTQGKRLRPMLVLLSTQSLGGEMETVKKLALAVELLHTATLVHDDILDEDVFRRNSLTANAKWGVRDAVLVGDALASLSMNLVADYDNDIFKIMSRTCLQLSDGEYLDVENATKPESENGYLVMIRKKSASLFEAAGKCGAMAAKGSISEIRSLGSFGENFGMAYQIKDDLSDMFSGGNALPQDIDEFRATLPIIHLCEKTSTSTVKEEVMRTIASMKTRNDQQRKILLDKLRKSLLSTGSWKYCICKMDQYIESAMACLETLNESIYRDYLFRMASLLRVV